MCNGGQWQIEEVIIVFIADISDISQRDIFYPLQMRISGGTYLLL
jgi:hypothetical protein